MEKKFAIAFFLAMLLNPELAGQDKKWTLEDCISYAVTNNISLKRQLLQTETAEVNYLTSRLNVLPSLNLGSDAQVGFGRSINPVNNLITFEQNIRNSYSLNTSMNLFSGFSMLNTIAANKFMYKAGLESEKVVRNTLIIDILGQYYQVLYARGLEDASKLQLELSEKQHYRVLHMVETGREALSKQYEMESQVSSDKLSYTIAQNSASQALTTLRQTLQLEPGTGFDIAIPEPGSMLISDKRFVTDSIFKIASQVLPRLKAIEYELAASRKQISAAKGSLSPTVTVGGAIYTGFYKVLTDTTRQMLYTDQLKNNNSQAVYLSLNIPIFNNYSVGRNIKNAKIRRIDTELRLQQEKNSLYTEIENACLNYNRGRDEYLAALSNYEFNKKSFEAVEKKFESGLVDVTDYSAAKMTLFRAETEALRTRIQLMIRKITISFYTTGEYENIIYN